MNFSFFDDNVSLTLNIFAVVANVIGILYNFPQVYTTWKTKSTKDFSIWFLVLRIVANSIWLGYSIEIESFQFLLSNLVSVLSTLFLLFYKGREIYRKRVISHVPFDDETELTSVV